MKRLTLAVVLNVLVVTAVLGQTSPSMRQLKLRDIRGRTIRLSDFRGKVVLVNFWATWCPPCRAEVPDLVKLQRKYRRNGLRVIGITYPPQTLAEVRRFARPLRINYPIALGTKQTRLLFSSLETMPLTVVLGKDGKIHDIIEGILLPDEFDQKIKPLLSKR